MDVNLEEAGWGIVTEPGAKKRDWMASSVSPAKVKDWTREAVIHHGAAKVGEVVTAVTDEPGNAPQNTTIAVVATSARLTKVECHRLAVMAQAGMARAIYPIHTPLDGDTVFALSTGDAPRPPSHGDLAVLGAHAANCLARAIARAVHDADAAPPGWAGPPAYRTRFPEGSR